VLTTPVLLKRNPKSAKHRGLTLADTRVTLARSFSSSNLDFQYDSRNVSLTAVKIIEPDLLEKALERLKAEFQPEEIYLFGSHAWGTPTEDSDVDLMVIVPTSDERQIRRDQRAQKCLGRLAMPADVLVRTRGEVNRFKHLRASLFHQVLYQGRKLYG